MPPTLPDTLPGLADLVVEVLGVDPWAVPGPWHGGVGRHVPLTVAAGRLVARIWLARRVQLPDESRWAAATVMSNDGWVLVERPDLYHFFGSWPLPYPWATAIPGIAAVTDPDEALRAACLALPTVADARVPTSSNRPPLDP